MARARGLAASLKEQLRRMKEIKKQTKNKGKKK